MAELRGVDLLQNELERARESLKDVDENIKKLTGRDPTVQRSQQRRVSVGNSEPRGGKSLAPERIFNLARRGIVQDDDGPRRRVGGAFSRLGPRPGAPARGRRGQDSGDEEERLQKPAIQSSVIATSRDERSRQNSIEEQSRDRKGQARNRRMFGLLLGTLQKFKDESKESKDKEEQRIKIEKKLEEKFKQEKEEIIRERKQLFLERRQKQFRIRLIEQKMEMAENHEKWAEETRKLENFIRTKAKPHLFYMPKILTPDHEAKLKDTKSAVDAMIEDRRIKLEQEIEEMMSQVHDAHGDDDDDDEHDDGEASMGEEEEGGSEEERERDEKENRERHKSGGKEDTLTEREMRDKEREERDRDRRMKDKRREERKRQREEEMGGRKSDGGRDRSREHGDRTKEREKEKEHGKHRDRSRSRSRERSRSNDHSRERHRSDRDRSDKRNRHHSESDKHSPSKNKRRSKDGKSEKREKVWEPMEDEEEEEFVGSKIGEKEGGNIQSKMLQMAGMSNVAKEILREGVVNKGENGSYDVDEDRGVGNKLSDSSGNFAAGIDVSVGSAMQGQESSETDGDKEYSLPT